MSFWSANYLLAGVIVAVSVPACAGSATSGSGSGGAGGNPSTGSSGSGGNTCGNAGSVYFSVSGNLGPSIGVGGASATSAEYDINGQVKSASNTSVVIETCAPGANCDSNEVTVTISGAVVPSTAVPVGALVRLRYFSAKPVPLDATPPGQAQDVILSNLASWGPLANPVVSNERVWFAASDRRGGVAPNPPASFFPFVVANGEAECGSASQYGNAFHFEMPNAPPLDVHQGKQGSVDATGASAGHYVFQAFDNIELDTGRYSGYWVVGS